MNQKGISSIVIILIIVGVLVIASGIWTWQSQKEKLVVCTQDTKLCPDGSHVSRIGPNCEFAACPEVKDETANWKTYRNEKYGFEVRYPEIRGSVEVMDREYFEICITGSELPGGLCFLISVRDINLDNFIKEWNSLDPPFTKIYQQEDYTLNGENATKLKSTTTLGIDTTFIFIEKNNKGYILEYGDYDPIHNQIISTFKFTQ